tara:strand:+ start:1968 stop:2981 length:1014 start_codon:yes stop_codon:yes gene_type:complete
MIESAWEKLQEKFPDIICNNSKYEIILKNTLLSPNNVLLYCSHGFPIDLMIDVILMKKLNKNKLYRTQHIWDKCIYYNENQYFIEIDLMNPDNIKNIDKLTKFLLHIVNTKSINYSKHLIILKHIDLLYRNFYDFRILLERFSSNITFISSTHNISKIELPIRSRYISFRIPLFSFDEINDIYINYLDMSLNDSFALTRSRNIVKSIFITDNESLPGREFLLTNSFINYNYPPFIDFIKKFDKKNLEEIRNLSYKCCQYNITIKNIVEDFLKLVDDENNIYFNYKYSKLAKKYHTDYKIKLKIEIIRYGSDIDYILSQTNKCKEPIYIEQLLCKLLI